MSCQGAGQRGKGFYCVWFLTLIRPIWLQAPLAPDNMFLVIKAQVINSLVRTQYLQLRIVAKAMMTSYFVFGLPLRPFCHVLLSSSETSPAGSSLTTPDIFSPLVELTLSDGSRSSLPLASPFLTSSCSSIISGVLGISLGIRGPGLPLFFLAIPGGIRLSGVRSVSSKIFWCAKA